MAQMGCIARGILDAHIAAQRQGVGGEAHAVDVGVAGLDQVTKDQRVGAVGQHARIAGHAALAAHLQAERGAATDLHVFAEADLNLHALAHAQALVGAVTDNENLAHRGHQGVVGDGWQHAARAAGVAGHIAPRADLPAQHTAGADRRRPLRCVMQGAAVHGRPGRQGAAAGQHIGQGIGRFAETQIHGGGLARTQTLLIVGHGQAEGRRGLVDLQRQLAHAGVAGCVFGADAQGVAAVWQVVQVAHELGGLALLVCQQL